MESKIRTGHVVLLLAMLSFIALTQDIVQARTSGVDLSIEHIRFDHHVRTNQLVEFKITVRNRGKVATQSLSMTFDDGMGGSGFAGPIIIKPGQTRDFTFGTSFNKPGEFPVKVTVNTDGDVNLKNNVKTVIIHVR
jgi:hypothetical protein